MKMIDGIHVVPVLAPVSTTAAKTTDVVGLKEYHAVKFLLQVGTLAANVAVTVTKSPNTTASGTDIAFRYRKSATVGTDTMGAWATAAAAGITLDATDSTGDEGKMVEILIDGTELSPVSGVEQPYVFATMTPAAASACLVSAIAVLEPRYQQAVNPSAVD